MPPQPECLPTHRAVQPNPDCRIAPPSRAMLTLLCWTALLVGTLAGLHHLSNGALAAPPVLHPATLGAWAAQRGAISIGFALARIASEVVAAYLLVVTLAGLVARAAGFARAARILDRLSVGVVKRVLGVVAGVSLATTAGATTALGHPAWATPAARAAPAPLSSTPDWTVPTMVAVPPAPPGEPPTQSVLLPQPVLPPQNWTIAPGQNLWLVAAATLAQHWQATPSDAEVERYWRQLIAANTSRFAHPGAPDLVFAGQVFALPPVPTPPPPLK